MKSKGIKIPMELVEILEKRSNGRTPGEKLHEIYKQYELIENFAISITVNRKDLEKATVYEKIRRTITDGEEQLKGFQTKIDELYTMLKGLEIFFTKVKK